MPRLWCLNRWSSRGLARSSDAEPMEIGSPSKIKGQGRLQRVCTPLHLAMFLIAVGAFIKSIQGLLVAVVARKGYQFWTITCVHGAAGCVVCLSVAYFRYPQGTKSLFKVSPDSQTLVLLRALLGGLTVITASYAVSYMDLGQATVIMATSPLFTAAMLSLFNEGEWGRSNTLSALACLFGMMLMTKSPPLFSRPSQALSDMVPGLLASSGSAISFAGVNVVIRWMPKEDLLMLTFYGMLGSLVLALPGCLLEQRYAGSSVHSHGRLWESRFFWTDLFLLSVPGAIGCLAAAAKTHALQICHVVSILVVLYLEPVCAVYWDWAVLGAEVDMTTLMGVATILTGCILSVLSDTSHYHPPAVPVAEKGEEGGDVEKEEDKHAHHKFHLLDDKAVAGVGTLRGKARSIIAA